MTELTQPDPVVKLKLKHIKSLLARFGNPQDKIANVIHIAGTNGKGSTLAFLERLLLKSGFNVSKYTSPHLTRLNERFCLNETPISDRELARWQQIIQTSEFHARLTFFERLTAIAFGWFAEADSDYCLLETGLGGRLDATNLVRRPTLCLITNIDYDHQTYLGDSLEEIAFEKAGILKPHTPFLTMAKEPALGVIRRQARAIGAIEIPVSHHLPSELKLGLAGEHQRENATLALNAFTYLTKNDSQGDIWAALSEPILWPGRLQKVTLPDGQSLWLDGAHNQAGALALNQSLNSLFPDRSISWLIGLLATKDYEGILSTFIQARKSDTVIFTYPTLKELSHPLSRLKDQAAAWLSPNQIICEPNHTEALKLLTQEAPEKIKVVCGSLYLIGNILKSLN